MDKKAIINELKAEKPRTMTRPKPKPKKSSSWGIVLTVIIAVILVGLCVFALQQFTLNQKTKQLKEDYQSQLDQVKNMLAEKKEVTEPEKPVARDVIARREDNYYVFYYKQEGNYEKTGLVVAMPRVNYFSGQASDQNNFVDYYSAVLSPDKSKIVYLAPSETSSLGQMELYVADVNGANKKLIAKATNSTSTNAFINKNFYWDNDGQKIYYLVSTAGENKNNSQIYFADLNNLNPADTEKNKMSLSLDDFLINKINSQSAFINIEIKLDGSNPQIFGAQGSGYKDYQNKNYNYSLKYPVVWKLQEAGNKVSFVNPSSTKIFEPLSVKVKKITPAGYVDEYNDLNKGVTFVVNQEEIKFNGLDAVKLITESAGYANNSYILLIPKGDLTYIIKYDETNQDHLNLIASFKINQ
jgi:hypothetical protein